MRSGVSRLLHDVVALGYQEDALIAAIRGCRHQRIEVLLFQVDQPRDLRATGRLVDDIVGVESGPCIAIAAVQWSIAC
jgi:hypothetical protein